MKVDFDKTRESAFGRWLSIFRALGIDVDETGKHSPCPVCSPGIKGSDRFRVDKNVSEKGTYFCNGCGPGDGFTLVMKVLGVDITTAMESVAAIVGSCEKNPIPKENAMTAEKMREIFNGSKIVTQGDPVHRYLTGRGLSKIPHLLRYHPAIWEPETKCNQKAMLAVLMNAENIAVTMHRTYLDADGNKLEIEKCKKILPCLKGKTTTGGACRLFPLDGRKILGVSEGIETAIAATEYFGVPTWAAISANGMESFVPPKGLNELMIFGDNDTSFAGHKAAYTLAHKAVVQFKIPKVSIHIPDEIGSDWADIWVKRK